MHIEVIKTCFINYITTKNKTTNNIIINFHTRIFRVASKLIFPSLWHTHMSQLKTPTSRRQTSWLFAKCGGLKQGIAQDESKQGSDIQIKHPDHWTKLLPRFCNTPFFYCNFLPVSGLCGVKIVLLGRILSY